MTDKVKAEKEFINEATEAYNQNLGAGCYVGGLLRIINRQNVEIEGLQMDVENYKQIAENQQSVSMDKEVEIKRLQNKAKAYKHYYDECLKDLKTANAEVKRLRDLNDVLETDVINANMNLEHIQYEFDLLKQEKSVVRAEAVKEFVERLKGRVWDADTRCGYVQVVDVGSIEDTLKEMVGAE